MRQVRDALTAIEGHTVSQAILAKRISVSAAYINAIEAGARPMTPDVAWRLFDLYGVAGESLLDKSKTAKHTLAFDLIEGIRLFRDKKVFEMMNADRVEVFERHIVRRLRGLLAAATARKKAPFLMGRIDQAIEDWVREFSLSKEYAEALKVSEPARPADSPDVAELKAQIAAAKEVPVAPTAKPPSKQSSPISPVRASNTSRRRKA